MTGNAIDIISMLFSKVYQLHAATRMPGTSWSIFGVIMIAVFLRLAIGLLRMIFGFSFGVAKSDYMYKRHFQMGRDLRGGNNKNIKISEERKNDTK